MSNTKYYTTLTGSKNNAGDYLIRHRGRQLLKWLRPDRQLKNLNTWEELTKESLDLINGSEALLLLGGPSLRPNMFPGIYKIREFGQIKVPVITMGIGWKSHSGDWSDSREYAFNSSTQEGLGNMEKQANFSSVRDYHSLNTLRKSGFKNFAMTGCPAYYSQDHLFKGFEVRGVEDIKKISFSLGVGHSLNKLLEVQTLNFIESIPKYFPNAELSVIFHHGIGEESLNTPDFNVPLYKANIRILDYCKKNNIEILDISGSEQGLIDHYSDSDLHIGYRVHAHIFMSSISKPSVLLNEDGRGKALKEVVNGLNFNSIEDVETSLFRKGLNRYFGIPNFKIYDNLHNEVLSAIIYDLERGCLKLSEPRASIDRHFEIMKDFIERLP